MLSRSKGFASDTVTSLHCRDDKPSTYLRLNKTGRSFKPLIHIFVEYCRMMPLRVITTRKNSQQERSQLAIGISRVVNMSMGLSCN